MHCVKIYSFMYILVKLNLGSKLKMWQLRDLHPVCVCKNIGGKDKKQDKKCVYPEETLRIPFLTIKGFQI